MQVAEEALEYRARTLDGSLSVVRAIVVTKQPRTAGDTARSSRNPIESR